MLLAVLLLAVLLHGVLLPAVLQQGGLPLAVPLAAVLLRVLLLAVLLAVLQHVELQLAGQQVAMVSPAGHQPLQPAVLASELLLPLHQRVVLWQGQAVQQLCGTAPQL